MDQNYTINNILNSAGLAIHGAASALAKTTVAAYYKITGKIYDVLAAADLPALTGLDVADGSTMALGVEVDSDGVVTYTNATVLNTAIDTGEIFPFPSLPAQSRDKALIGYIFIKAAGASFTGGTTHLDAANITVTYIDAFGWVGA